MLQQVQLNNLLTYLNQEQIIAFLIFVFKDRKFGIHLMKILRQLPSIEGYKNRIVKKLLNLSLLSFLTFLHLKTPYSKMAAILVFCLIAN